MAPTVEISIPTTSVSSDPKPHTLYDIALRLPLRSYTIQKRYSDFLTLHSALTVQAGGTPPPFLLPGKSWFSRTVSSPTLTEERRSALEFYLKGISDSSDRRWQQTSAWRAFLNLPASLDNAYSSSSSSSASQLHGKLVSPAGAGAPITDSRIWIDCHRELKTYLHDARLFLAKRDAASTAQAQHESSAGAKRNLVRAGAMIAALEQGLKNLSSSSSSSSKTDALGEGELRRRKDLVSNARQEHDGLELLVNSMAARLNTNGGVGGAAASQAERAQLLSSSSAAASTNGRSGGRVLGRTAPETERTRELDNGQVLQLQRQMMDEQDTSLEQLQKVVARQRQIGLEINNELEEQVAMLKLVDEDVDRLDGKVRVAKKRVGKIS